MDTRMMKMIACRLLPERRDEEASQVAEVEVVISVAGIDFVLVLFSFSILLLILLLFT
jgi:hypothetical protein